MANTKSFFLILGMHRSGTSCLTGALERCGVYLGKVSRKGKYNKKGNHERKEVFKLHDQILRLNLGSWHQPPIQKIEIHPYFIEVFHKIIQELKQKEIAGLKDPRLLLILDMWKQLLGTNYQLIGTFRHPIAVAHSLAKRDNLALEQGLALWVKYNKILVSEHREQPFPIIHYNLVNSNDYYENICNLALAFHLKPQRWKLRRFITSKLEHHQFNSTAIPESCKEVYNYLIENKYRNER